MVRQTACIAILSLALAGTASAQSTSGVRPRPGTNQALQSLRGRIQQGVRQGQITRPELSGLRAHAERIRQLARSMREARQSGAAPTPADRQRLRQELRTLNREIFTARHNRRR
jgi:hypothetical protein